MGTCKGEAKEGLDIALCSFDQESRILEYTGAFNPMYFIRNNQLTEIKADKQPIGIYPGKKNTAFTNHTLAIQPGDAVYLFTDGLPTSLVVRKVRNSATSLFRNYFYLSNLKKVLLSKNCSNMLLIPGGAIPNRLTMCW